MGDIQSEEHTKDSGIFNQPLPRTDSYRLVLLDLFGVSRTITVTGIFEGTIAEQKTFIAAIEGINNGTQVSSNFVSSLTTSITNWDDDAKQIEILSYYRVFIQTFRWTKSAADVGKINYTLTMLEGAAVDIN